MAAGRAVFLAAGRAVATAAGRAVAGEEARDCNGGRTHCFSGGEARGCADDGPRALRTAKRGFSGSEPSSCADVGTRALQATKRTVLPAKRFTSEIPCQFPNSVAWNCGSEPLGRPASMHFRNLVPIPPAKRFTSEILCHEIPKVARKCGSALIEAETQRTSAPQPPATRCPKTRQST